MSSCPYLGLWRAVMAEALGTLLLTLSIGPITGHLQPTRSVDVLLYGVLYASATVTLSFVFRDVSGGHLNPAITVATIVSRRVHAGRAILYLSAQCSGAIVGSGLIFAILRDRYVGATTVDAALDIAQAFGLETMGTFIYVFAFFAAMDRNRKTGQTGGSSLVMAASLLAASIFTRPYTGGSLNPARSLGPAVIENQWDRHWVFWLGPLVGGSVGGFLYDLVFAGNASRRRAVSFISDAEYDADHVYDVTIRVVTPPAPSSHGHSRRHHHMTRAERAARKSKLSRDQKSKSSSHLGGDENLMTYEKMASV